MKNRSKWKGFYTDAKFIKNLKNERTSILEIPRKYPILPKLVGKTVNVHSGKSFSKITVVKNMIGHKFGEFVNTREKFIFKKKKKKKKR